MNDFSGKKKASFSSDYHHVSPHYVKAYMKKDGTFVSSSWRDGDGNSKINSFGGYFAANPGHKK